MKCANILCFFYSFFQRVGYILHTLGQKRTGCWLYFTHSWLNFTTNYTYTILTITILNGKNKMISLFWLLVFGIPTLIVMTIMKLFDDNEK